MAEAPRYIGKLLAGLPPQEARDPRTLHLHLGWWEAPPGAVADHAELLAAQRRLDERVRAMAALAPGQAVLDVGCGVGGTIAAAADSVDGVRFAGLNIDRAQLAVARGVLQGGAARRVLWVAGDACALPFGDAQLDAVLAIECAFHFASRRRFLAEAARVLRPGGRLAMSDFVAAPELRALRDREDFPAFALESAVVPAVGPWPDFWGDGPGHEVLARAAGLEVAAHEDASAQTLPSFRAFLRGKWDAGPPRLAALDPVERALVVLEWLQRRGLLRMELLVFTRRGAAGAIKTE